jgi:putative transposase
VLLNCIVGFATYLGSQKYYMGALKMALQTRKKKTELVHHSDSGVQYCSWAYVDLIQKAGIKMSMCSSPEPNENSMAERLNPGYMRKKIRFSNVVKKQPEKAF